MLHAIVHSAGIQDRDGGTSLLATLFGQFPFLEKLFADSAYQGPIFANALAKFLPRLETEIVKRSDHAKGFVQLPKRWIVERIYCGFVDMLQSMQRNTTCSCNACRNIKALDLKFFLHFGEYATQTIAGRTELQGFEVIRLHRLLKNKVTNTTGIEGYALVTEAAADAIALPQFFADAVRHVEQSDDFGETAGYVYDLAPVFARWHAARRVVVAHDEPLCFRWSAICRCRRRSLGLCDRR